MDASDDAKGAQRAVDPITLEVIRHGVISITDQIDANITRTAFSPYIYEYKDFAVGLVGLAVWLGATPDVALGYSVRARLTKVDGGVDLQALRASAGGTTVAGAVGASWRDQDLLLETRLRFESVDLDELSAVFGADDADDEARQGLNLYMPILPYEMRIVDANLDVAVDRVAHRRVDVTDLTFTGRIREGRLQPSPFSVRLGRTPLDGRLGLDLRSKTPVATLALRSADVDVGALLSDLDVFADFESTARLLEADVVLRGSTLKSILASSEVAVVIEDAVTTLRDRNTGAPLVVEVATGSLTASPGNAISYEARGRIGAVPVTLSVSTDPLATFLEPRERIPLRLTADLAGLQLALAASAARPISLRDLRFELSAEGTRLDSLNELLQVSVPPWGPYGFAGGVELDRVGYHGRNLRVRVGSSQLAGNVSLNTTGARPRLLVDLKSETLQLDDFRAGNWSAFGNSEASASIDSSGHDLRSFQRKKEAAAALVTRERVRALDARVTLEVKEVLSGRDRLGSGALVVTLEDGRFSVESLTIDIPEGSLSAQFGFEIADGGFDAWTRAEIERLDYGVLARRIDPDSEPEGWLSLSVDLRSRSESLGEMLAGASGRFDFAVWPKNMQADVFDLWAANLVLAILPRLDTDAGPTINCVVGLLDMSDGTMTPKSLFIDTTNVQVSGTGEADFATQRLDFKFKPKAKRPKMFRLGTPIQVRGDFSDFRAGASPDEVVITAFRFATSVLAPLQRIFSAPVSADGEAACLAAMQRAPEPAR